jgi:ornithine cyclodeaminase
MKYFTSQEVSQTRYAEFIPFLKRFYRKEVTTPARPHYSLGGSDRDILLVMPGWEASGYIGVKLVTVFPANAQKGEETIQGIYVLMDREVGSVLCTIDGASLTAIRTAAVSAAAASIICPGTCETMTMVGTGRLSPELIKAHCSQQPLKQIYIWGRNEQKAIAVAHQLDEYGIPAKPTTDLSKAVHSSDLVSVATLSHKPLIMKMMLPDHVHLDLVGSFTPDVQEAESSCFEGAHVYVDDYSALETAGDLVIPIEEGTIQAKDVRADLRELCREEFLPSNERHTVFKSVGKAQSDMALAAFLYEKMTT